MNACTFQDFEKLEIRSGIIIKAEFFDRAKKPAYKIWADFGSLYGIKQTSAQITKHYTTDTLIGKQIIGCINLGTKNIAGFASEFLLVGFSDEQGYIVLAVPDKNIPKGQKLC